MDREGALPHRCIVCNADADRRFALTLYASPPAWRIFAAATPFVVLGIGTATNTPELTSLFLPIALLMMVVHAFVRKKIELELSICARHRRLRMTLGALAVACMVGIAYAASTNLGFPLIAVLVVALVGLALAWSNSGVQAVSISKVTEQHLWIARTGKAFRAALPELPAAK